ncbi:MAG: hypothetical protein ABF760_02525 [Zymomonas mobilis]|uniref:Uncharacterized protein n=1 Tax=Zymomonas mobilis TaxID=542 RepID=A0A542W2X1_ZYMMB|nr:hypothetical protein [Zymomonas mobilis]TQL17934.1 hypothetical protein FBY58_1547 [Zymomonas mobilis]
MFLFLATLLSCLGSLLFYLTSDNQRLLLNPLEKQPFTLIASLIEFMALLFLWQEKSLASAFLILAVLLMIEWSFLPLVIALFPRRRRKL